MNRNFWLGRRVFLTGHSGFKGGWLAIWLRDMGAEVFGYALPPSTQPSLHDLTGVADRLTGATFADIRDAGGLSVAMQAAEPEVVFHLAAQPLVRQSYLEPVETFATNVMGTVNLLEAVRNCSSVRAILNVTTDKCYENKEWCWGYRENEPLGGYDPYSSSKACAELVSAAYRQSFLAQQNRALATARAGNVIGGGDWAAERLIPDILRASDQGARLQIRSPDAIRPWQHVLEPLCGYLTLAEKLHEFGNDYAGAWNFGPSDADAKSVRWIVEQMSRLGMVPAWQLESSPQPHEANYLKLDSSKARAGLGWLPRWQLSQALEKTLDWHLAWRNGMDMHEFCLRQIREYESLTPV